MDTVITTSDIATAKKGNRSRMSSSSSTGSNGHKKNSKKGDAKSKKKKRLVSFKIIFCKWVKIRWAKLSRIPPNEVFTGKLLQCLTFKTP